MKKVLFKIILLSFEDSMELGEMGFKFFENMKKLLTVVK
jgi:hypothetical protein